MLRMLLQLGGNAQPQTSLRRQVSPAITSTTTSGSGIKEVSDEEWMAEQLSTLQGSLIHHDGKPRYIVMDKLGEGSQGTVYRVEDRDCHREMAFKVLSVSRDREEVSRFIREAQITAQLEHPGVVPVHDLGVLPDGTLFYSMKRLDGQQMSEYIVSRGGKSEHRFQLMEIFLSVCQTIAFAHSRGVIHRDIKPRNIMVSEFGVVQVMDWGLAKVIGSQDQNVPRVTTGKTTGHSDMYRTNNGTAVGTPAYMSPEQANGEIDTLDQRCDIYSLGVILYEILCGTLPYARGNVMRVLCQVRDGSWVRLDQQAAARNIPRPLIAVVHRAMALSRHERYQTVEQMVADLRAFISGQAVSAYQESLAERVIRALSRNSRLRFLIFIGAFFAALTGLSLLYILS
jgi:serine/threonine protein kinase